MAKAQDRPDYRSFVLVCWQERSQDAAENNLWRYRLEDPHSGMRWGFVNLLEVAEFLHLKLTDSQG
ncbi:MAG: hypothetical protein M9928_13425 [Anaerolineae bacterium]|nr:hypothetical protein [Anaerolineae bacterium]MCO5194246.1 hypothetical protein [Anaerolineae bacterium]MCO5199566.1 hypothetical protein [Anaerolineae bacterium]MCO5206031.1 hypothetical protein [Anaerolineae bacterium]